MLISIRDSFLGPAGLILLGAVVSGIGAFWAAFQQVHFEQELRVRSDKIAELSQSVLNSVTGGDSFCFFEFIGPSPEAGQLMLLHKGKYPIYDIQARILDLDDKRHMGTPEEKMEALKGTNVHIGNLAPGVPRLTVPWRETVPGRLRLNIYFIARNGIYVQLYRRVTVGNRQVTATKVQLNGAEVFEDIPEKFPRNSEGDVEW